MQKALKNLQINIFMIFVQNIWNMRKAFSDLLKNF